MARRRFSGRRMGGRGQRRSTFWADLVLETTFTDTGLGTNRNVTLYQPADEDESVTVLRIVGTVALGLQANAAVVQAVHWGVYVSSQGSTDTLLTAVNSTDVSSEDWLFWNAFYVARNDIETGQPVIQEKVDIRAKRKLDQSKHLVWTAQCAGVAWSSAINLRGLFMRSAS